MEFNSSDYGSYEYDLTDRLESGIETLSQLISSIPGIFTQLDSFKDQLEEIRNNSLTPGTQFLLMYFLGMLDKSFKSKKVDAKILKVLLNNGNIEDFRHWLTESGTQINVITALGSQTTEPHKATQPFTLKNLNKVCKILEEHGLEETFTQPFQLRDKVESFQK